MNMYLVWPLWVISIILAIILSFAALEAYALKNHVPTFSRFVWEITVDHPAIIVIFVGVLGFVLGFLSCHFWWGGMISFAPVKKLLGG